MLPSDAYNPYASSEAYPRAVGPDAGTAHVRPALGQVLEVKVQLEDYAYDPVRPHDGMRSKAARDMYTRLFDDAPSSADPRAAQAAGLLHAVDSRGLTPWKTLQSKLSTVTLLPFTPTLLVQAASFDAFLALLTPSMWVLLQSKMNHRRYIVHLERGTPSSRRTGVHFLVRTTHSVADASTTTMPDLSGVDRATLAVSKSSTSGAQRVYLVTPQQRRVPVVQLAASSGESSIKSVDPSARTVKGAASKRLA